MARVMGATDYKNQHSKVETYYDVALIVNLLVAGNVFQEQTGRGSGKEAEEKSINLFNTGSAKLSLRVTIQDYKVRSQHNWVRGAGGCGNNDDDVLFSDNLEDLVECGTGENSINAEYD